MRISVSVYMSSCQPFLYIFKKRISNFPFTRSVIASYKHDIDFREATELFWRKRPYVIINSSLAIDTYMHTYVHTCTMLPFYSTLPSHMYYY